MKIKLYLSLSFFAIAFIFFNLNCYKNDNKDFVILDACKEIKPLESSTKKSYEEFVKSLRLIKKITFKTYQYFTTLIANKSIDTIALFNKKINELLFCDINGKIIAAINKQSFNVEEEIFSQIIGEKTIDNKLFFLCSYKRKIYCYNFSGDYLFSINLKNFLSSDILHNFSILDFYFIKDKIYLLCENNRLTNEKIPHLALIAFSLSDSVVKIFQIKTELNLGSTPINLEYFKSKVFLTSQFDSRLFIFDPESEIFCFYHISSLNNDKQTL